MVAAEHSMLAEVQYLHHQGCPWPGRLLERLQAVVTLSSCDGVTSTVAVGSRRVRLPTLNYAAASGNVELMAWVLQQPGTQLSTEAMVHAA
eukprot:839-Heterococcus_DN1.PRE.2